MKKHFKSYILFWAVLLVVFNVIAFISVGWRGAEKYTPSFWIGYSFITVSFIGQLVCTAKTIDADTSAKTFYNISLISASYAGLIASFVVGGLCMLISNLPYWLGAVLCVIVLALNIIAVTKASVAIAEVERVDEKIKNQTFFIKALTVEAEGLVNCAKTGEIKKECVKVYEAVRYSDKMSNPALAEIESRLREKLSSFSNAVSEDDEEKVKALALDILSLIKDRNNKCKLMK